MKALIVDDERLARSELRRLLRPFPWISVVAEARNAEEALREIERRAPDLLFLDIQMPGKDGFELLESLDVVPEVIFTTAFDRYAIRAFEVSALDYLLKPIDPRRLTAALDKLKRRLDSGAKSDPRALGEADQVFLRDGERCWLVRLRDIRLLESEGNYTRVYFDEHRPLIPRSLNSLETRLDPELFFRGSRKHIFNLRWIEALQPAVSGGLRVRLRGGQEVEMSRRQAQVFRETRSV